MDYRPRNREVPTERSRTRQRPNDAPRRAPLMEPQRARRSFSPSLIRFAVILLILIGVALVWVYYPRPAVTQAPRSMRVEKPTVTEFAYGKVGEIVRDADAAYIVVGDPASVLDRVVREPFSGGEPKLAYASMFELGYIFDVEVLDADHIVVDDRPAGTSQEANLVVVTVSTGETKVIASQRIGEFYPDLMVVAGGAVYWQELSLDVNSSSVMLKRWDPASGKVTEVMSLGNNLLPMTGTSEYLYYVEQSADGGTADAMRFRLSDSTVEAIQGVEGAGWNMTRGDGSRAILSTGDPIYGEDEVFDVLGDDNVFRSFLMDIGDVFGGLSVEGDRLGVVVAHVNGDETKPGKRSLLTLDMNTEVATVHPLVHDGVDLSAINYYFVDEDTVIAFGREHETDGTMYRFVIELTPIGPAE